MFLSADRCPSQTNFRGRLSWNMRRPTWKDAAAAEANGADGGHPGPPVDLTTVIFVESTFAQMEACSKSRIWRRPGRNPAVR